MVSYKWNRVLLIQAYLLVYCFRNWNRVITWHIIYLVFVALYWLLLSYFDCYCLIMALIALFRLALPHFG